MIEIQSLTKNYGSRIAIDQLSFQIQKGEVVGFLGPNGAGKTTTMKIITGFMAPTSGAVKIAGYDVFENPIEVKKRIGYLPETPPVYGDMSIEDYLYFVSHLKGVDKKNRAAFVENALQKTHLKDVRHRLIQNLSKGFRQRVGIAQAIVSQPEILILDEPTVGLDPRQVAEIRQLLIELKGQHTIILSTHILSEVEATCERVIIIDKGRIVAQNTISALSDNSAVKARKIIVRVRRAQPTLTQTLMSWAEVKNVLHKGSRFEIDFEGDDETLEKITQLFFTEKAGLLEVIEPAKGLESVFIELTSQPQGVVS